MTVTFQDFLMSLDLESMDSFTSAHQRVVDKLSELMFTPKTFNPNIDEKKQSVRDRKLSEYQVAYVRTYQRSHVQSATYRTCSSD